MNCELIGKQKLRALPLFQTSAHHRMAAACCAGLCEGRVFADDLERPTAALAVLQRMGIGFAAGDARHAGALLSVLRGWHPWYEISDPPKDWHPYMAAWSEKSHAAIRYGFANDPPKLSDEALEKLARTPAGCTLSVYDRLLAEQALSEAWSEDQLGAFASVDDFLGSGLGVALVRDGRLLAGCASFCKLADGFEIQIDTHPDERGKGYGSSVGAAFLLECRRRGVTPYWDAANQASLRLAEKLGYVFTEPYVAWVLLPPEADTEAVIKKVIG